ncbi:MAG: O-antigen ligase family protein [Flavobacteriales bacterium]
MLERWFGPKIHHYLHLLGLMLVAFGLPFNKVLMSIGTIWGVANILLEGKFQDYSKRIINNKPFLFLLGFFLLHLGALLWTENWEYAFHDIRIKLPLLALPLALVAHPIIKRNEINLILLTFLTSLTLISIYNGYHYTQLSQTDIANNYREISQFGSHIRFSLLVVLGLVLLVYFFFQYKKWRLLFAAVFLWFAVYTYFSQVLSAPLSILFLLIFILIYKIWPKRLLRYSAAAISVLIFTFGVISVQKIGHPKFDFSQLDEYSIRGNLYYHDSIHPSFENGKPVNIYISYDELESEWDKYFTIPYNGFDRKNNPIKGTLYRYMTALDLRKDLDGLKMLTKKDIENIQNGIATPDHLKRGFEGRFASLKYALENQDDPNNSTILQRIEYWKTAGQIISKSPILGVGTGDVQDAFDKQYELNDTRLSPPNRLRAHNMFLTIQLSFGILGSILFLLFIAKFLQFNRSVNQLLGFCLFGVMISSFFIEDTLETQTGVTMFSFFIGLILVKWEKTKPADS